MAPRRGKFGNQPSAAPDLTSTLVSIATGMQNQDASNIMDAWKNGGTFNGKPVTDQVVLAYWQDRLAHIPKTDPEYTTDANLIQQTTYTIAESKMNVLYQQKKVTDGQMAQFYLNWEKKVPANSEFARTLAVAAAKFVASARAGSAASGKAAAAAAYVASQNALTARTGGAWDSMAKIASNIINQGQAGTLQGALTLLNGNSPHGKTNAQGNQAASGSTILYYADRNGNPTSQGQGGVPFTVAMARAQQMAHNPSWNGVWSLGAVDAWGTQKSAGLTTAFEVASKTGHKTDMKTYTDAAGILTGQIQGANLASVDQTRAMYYNQFLAVWSDPTASALDKTAALNTYDGRLMKLSTDPSITKGAQQMLIDEAQHKDVPTLADNPTAGPMTPAEITKVTGVGTNGLPNGSNAQTAYALVPLQAGIAAVAAGQGVWVTGYTDPKTQLFTPGGVDPNTGKGGGSVGMVGSAGFNSVTGLATGPAGIPGSVPVHVLDSSGHVITVWGIPHNITETAIDAQGNKVQTLQPNGAIVGQYMDTPEGRQYSYVDPITKLTQWSATPKFQVGDNTNPFVNGGKGTGVHTDSVVDPSTGNMQVTMTFSGLDTTPGGASGVNWADILTASHGLLSPTQDAKGIVNGVRLATGALFSTDPVNQTLRANGITVDPNTDFFSPTLSALHNAPDNTAALAAANANPAYVASLKADAFNAASKLPPDQQRAAYDQMTATISRELDPNSQDHILPANSPVWAPAYTTSEMTNAMNAGGQYITANGTTQFVTPGGTTTPPGHQPPEANPNTPLPYNPTSMPQVFTPVGLPSDSVSSTGPFGPLGAMYRPGTSIIPAGKSADDLAAGGVPAIKIGAPVTMPGMPVDHPLIGAGPRPNTTSPAGTPVVTQPPSSTPPVTTPTGSSMTGGKGADDVALANSLNIFNAPAPRAI